MKAGRASAASDYHILKLRRLMQHTPFNVPEPLLAAGGKQLSDTRVIPPSMYESRSMKSMPAIRLTLRPRVDFPHPM